MNKNLQRLSMVLTAIVSILILSSCSRGTMDVIDSIYEYKDQCIQWSEQLPTDEYKEKKKAALEDLNNTWVGISVPVEYAVGSEADLSGDLQVMSIWENDKYAMITLFFPCEEKNRLFYAVLYDKDSNPISDISTLNTERAEFNGEMGYEFYFACKTPDRQYEEAGFNSMKDLCYIKIVDKDGRDEAWKEQAEYFDGKRNQ